MLVRAGGDQDWLRSVVGTRFGRSEVDESLASHTTPLAVTWAYSLACGSTPEECAVFVLERRIWEFLVGIVSDFIHVVPGRWIEDVVEAMSFALGENREQVVGTFEGSR